MKNTFKGSQINMLIASLIVIDNILENVGEGKVRRSLNHSHLEDLRLRIMLILESKLSTVYGQMYSNKRISCVGYLVELRLLIGRLFVEIKAIENYRMKQVILKNLDLNESAIILSSSNSNSEIVGLGIHLKNRIKNKKSREAVENFIDADILDGIVRYSESICKITKEQVILKLLGKLDDDALSEMLDSIYDEMSSASEKANKLFEDLDNSVNKFNLSKVIERLEN